MLTPIHRAEGVWQEDASGRKQGRVVTYGHDGKTHHIYHAVDDEMHGISRCYYNCGNIAIMREYDHGEPVGYYLQWHPCGKIYRAGFVRRDDTGIGSYRGEYICLQEDGQVRQHAFFAGCETNDVYKEVVKMVEDIRNITDEEKMMIKIRFGIPCIDFKQAQELRANEQKITY